MSDAGSTLEAAPGEPPRAPVGQAGAAGSEPGDVVPVAGPGVVIPGAVPDAAAAEAMEPQPRTPLRSAAVGEAPVFDPGSVYLLGYAGEFEGGSWLSIAPVDHPTDSVGSFSYFVDAMIRRSDGRLLYQDNSKQDYLNEFLRDASPSDAELNATGETVHRSSVPCDPDELAPPEGYQRRYLLSWDDVLYHTCAVHDSNHAIGDDIKVWYTADGELVYDGELWLIRIGAQRRALAYAEDDLVVLDLDSGEEVASIPVDGLDLGSSRSHAEGFTLALYAGEGNDGERYWMDIDLDGAVVARGQYAPLPPNTRYVTYGTNSLATRTGAIDGQGRLHEFAGTLQDGSAVVIRRPRDGASEIVFGDDHDSQDETLVHLGPVLLITGE